MPRRSNPGRDAWALMAEICFSDQAFARFHDACAAAGLTPPQLKALQSIHAGEPKPMGVLADRWGCDASWVTGIVDALEERGLVERRVLASDRRVKTVALTPLGAKALEQADQVLHEPPASMAALTRDEQRALRDLLRKLVDAN